MGVIKITASNEVLDEGAANLKDFMQGVLLPGRELSLFETKLEEAIMWAKKGIKNANLKNKEEHSNE